MDLNVSKYKIITFFKKRSAILKKYLLYGIELDRVNHRKIVGIYLDYSLLFSEHYINMQNRASSLLYFIHRSCNNFDNPTALKSLYCAFVRSVLVIIQ